MIRNVFIPFALFVLFALSSGCATSHLEIRPYQRGEVTPWCTSTICPSSVAQKFLADFWKDTADGQGKIDEFITIFNDQWNYEGWRLRLPSADELGHRSHGHDDPAEFILTYRPEDAKIHPLYHGQLKWTVSLRTYPTTHYEVAGSRVVFKAYTMNFIDFYLWNDQTKN